MTIEVDTSARPLVRVSWPNRVVDVAELQAFIDGLLATPPGPTFVLVDARRAAPLGFRAMTRAIRAESKFRRHGVCARAIVVPERGLPWVQPALTTFPLAIPTRAFAALEPAERWLASVPVGVERRNP